MGPRSTGSWQVEGKDGVIAVKSDGVKTIETPRVDANGNPVLDNEGNPIIDVTYDDSTVGTYAFDELPAAYTSAGGVHYLASYRVELGEFNQEDTRGDAASASDDEQWLLTRYHEGESADTDSDANGGADASAVKPGAGGGVAFTAQDTVTTLSGAEKDGVRAHSGHIIVAGASNDTSCSNVDPNTTAIDLQASKVTIPVSDVLNVAAPAQGADADLLVSREEYVTYDWLTYRQTVDENGDVVLDEDGEPLQVIHGGDAGEVKPPTQSITGVVWNDADNDGMRGTKGADGAWTGLAEGEELLPGVQLTLERYYQVVGDPQATWTYDPTWAVNDGAYQADPTVGLLGDTHSGATPAPAPAPDDADDPDAPATREGEGLELIL